MVEEISLEEFQGWLALPVTQAFLGRLRSDLEELKNAWADSVFMGQDIGEMSLKNVYALGQAVVLRRLIEMRYEDRIANEEANDGE